MTETEIAQVAGGILQELDKKYTRFDESKYDATLFCDNELDIDISWILPILDEGSFKKIHIRYADDLAGNLYDFDSVDGDTANAIANILNDVEYIISDDEGDDSLNNISDEFDDGLFYLVFKNG